MGVRWVSRGRSDGYWDHQRAIEARGSESIGRAESAMPGAWASLAEYYQCVREQGRADPAPGDHRD
ncbi:hypothetical protein [Rhodococcus koreensis]